MPIRLMAIAGLLALLALGTACREKRAPDPECQVMIGKVLQCDPTAPPSLRDEPEKACPATRMACAKIDTTTAAGCAKFMGCLYDGP
jgi:hypothetical protein